MISNCIIGLYVIEKMGELCKSMELDRGGSVINKDTLSILMKV